MQRLDPVPVPPRISADAIQPDLHDCVFLPTNCPSPAEEVRIFVGTEPAEQRAERALLWSILRNRDPRRAYRIIWLRELAGFESAGRETQFEGYGFAVPHLCAGAGRALYCGVDQVFERDPAQLYDAELGDCAWLSAPDASLMLIDCERCAEAWPIERVRGWSHRDLREAQVARRGPLPATWLRPRGGVVRFAALHTQPWRPFPDRFVYQNHPRARIWTDLEREALAAGFEVHSRERPSARFSRQFPRSRPSPDGSADDAAEPLARLLDPSSVDTDLSSEGVAHDVAIRDALARCGGKRVTVYGLGRGAAWRRYLRAPHDNEPRLNARWGADDVDVCEALEAPPQRNADLAICTGTLEQVPTEDLPWVLGEVFASADSCVHLGIRTDGEPALRSRRTARPLQRSERWWIGQVEHAARLHPDVHWQVVFGRGARTRIRHGGRHLGGKPPTVWVLTDDRPGNTSQSVGLAESLGWPYAVKRLHFSASARLHNRLLDASRIGIRTRRSTLLAPPWPDLVIAAGRRSASIAQWIRRRNFGQTRLVHLGRKGGDAANRFDLVVTPTYGRLDPHPRRLVTSAPLHNIREPLLSQAAQHWSELLGGAKRPRIVLLVGGWSGQYRLDVATARALGRRVREFAESVGGSILATTSRRTTEAASTALCAELGAQAHVHRWEPGNQENPYLAFLALADAFVITGDSESMLSEAASRGRPIYIYGLPVRASFAWMRVGRDWVYARAHAQRPDVDGIEPGETQNGLGYLCARLIDLGFVRPTRDLDSLHAGLIAEGAARRFGEPFESNACAPLGNEERVVQRVCKLMGHEALP
jgi:hypothetical protein